MLLLYKSWKKYNEFQLTKNKIDLNTQKWKIIHPPISEESHPVTDSLGKTVDETGHSLSLPNQNTIIINKIWNILEEMEKVLWNSIDKKQNRLKYSKNDKSSTLPRFGW